MNVCGYCYSKLTSLHSQVALAQKAPLTLEQREWLFKWFLTTKYFAFHRRMSRGRAKKLLQLMANDAHNQRHDAIVQFMGSSELNPANVAIRGPHDLVTDAASLQT